MENGSFKTEQTMENRHWLGVIDEMERAFAISGDPHIRIRIGDARRKLNKDRDAVCEYIFAGDLFARAGFVAKALAQYGLALRLDPENIYALRKRECLRWQAEERQQRPRTIEYRLPENA